MTIIVFEGLDGAGKSTLMKIISRKLKIPIIKPLTINKKIFMNSEKLEEYAELINKCLMNFKKFNFILNRNFSGSIIYSKVYKRKYDLKYIDNFLIPQLEGFCKIIFLTTNSYKTNLKRRLNDKLINKNKYEELWSEHENYFKNFKNNKIPVLKLNTDKLSRKEYLEKCLKFIGDLK